MNFATTMACAISVSVAASASAGMNNPETYNGSVPLTTTEWVQDVDVPQFDPMNGTRELICVELFIKGTVSGTAEAESLDKEPAEINVDLSAEVGLALNMTNLGVVIPIADASFSLVPTPSLHATSTGSL